MKRHALWFTAFMLFASVICRADQHALLIGIDEYQDRNSINPLSAAAADAKALVTVLREAAGVPEENIVLLTSDGEKKPTGANIIFEVSQLVRRAKPGDTVFIFFSGHGIEMDGTSYLLPWDTDVRTDATMKRTALATAEIHQLLGKLSAQALIMAFDMCRNDPRRGGKSVAATNTLTEAQARDLVLKPVVGGTGPRSVVSIFSCRPQERSWEWQDKRRGFFSYFLEEGLRRGAADTQGVVRVKNLVPYLEKAVYGAVQRELGKEQTPYCLVEGPGALELVLASGRPSGSGGATAVGKASTTQERVDAAIQRGSEAFQQRRYEDALAALKEALLLDPRSDKAMHWMGWVYSEGLKDTAEAERWYRRALEVNPKRSSTINNLGYLCKQKGSYLEAELLYRRAIEVDPSNVAPYSNLGDLFRLYLKNSREAETWYRKAVGLDPKTAWRWNDLGLSVLEIGEDMAEAERCFRRAMSLDPKYDSPYHNLAYINYNYKRDYPEAERLYRQSIERNPRSATSHNNLAILCYVIKKDYDEAERLFQKAIELDPKYETPYYELAGIYKDVRKDNDEAERLYRRIMEMKPSSAEPVNRLALFMEYYRRNYREAERLYRRAVEMVPESGLYADNLGVFLLNRQRNAEAEEVLRKAISLSPQNGKYHADYAYSLLRLNRREEALEEAKKARELGYKGSHPVFKELELDT